MKQALILAYHYPPVGGGAVQRTRSLVRYLPQLGWEPIVVTGHGGGGHHWAPRDSSLDDLPENVRVVRASSEEPAATAGFRRRIDRVFDRQGRWNRWWVESATELAIEHGRTADVIYASLEPYDTARAAAAAARRLDKPWVADLQDPWALDEMRLHLSWAHRRRDLARMRDGLSSAAAVVMNTKQAAGRLSTRFPEIDHDRVFVVPNGFDASDFASSGRLPNRHGRPFRIVHTGYLHTEMGLKLRRTRPFRRALGALYMDVDIATRSHLVLVDAIKQLQTRRPDMVGKVEVHLAGALTTVDESIAREAGFVRMLGYVSHEESVELLKTADLLFLPMHNVGPKDRAGLIPGKTYEYLASGRPILAAVPDGDAKDILLAAGTAAVVRPDDVAGMSSAIESALDATSEPQPNRSVIQQFERRTLARSLAAVLDGAAAGVSR